MGEEKPKENKAMGEESLCAMDIDIVLTLQVDLFD